MTDVNDARQLRRHLNPPPARNIARLGLILTLAVVPITGCGGDAAPPADLSLLLVTLDTTRADVLGCYGGGEAETPNLDRLAEEGVRFDKCTACTPMTAPSHATILTGTWPMVHKVRTNGVGKLSDSAVTVAEVLQARGVVTRAAVAAFVVKRQFGLAQGFEVYDDAMPPIDSSRPVLGKPADLVAEAAIGHLRELAGSPFFLWVHFYDPHHPYLSRAGNHPDSREAYMEEIELVDRQLGRILGVVDALGVKDTTAVVVLGDHGEGLGDHGELDHGFFLYETTQRVPLIARVPGWTPAGGVISSRVRTVDVAPTLLELAGAEPPATMQGESLVTILRDPAAGQDRAAYSEAWQVNEAFRLPPLRAVNEGSWKLVDGSEPLLFDLSVDPGETENVASAHGDRVAAMRRTLEEFIGVGDTGEEGQRLDVTDETAAALDALGYTAAQGDAMGSTTTEHSPFDLKDDIGKYALASRVMTTDPDLSRALLEEVILAHPEAPGPFFRQMRLLMSLPDGDGRIDFCREVLVARPDAMLPRLHLAQLLLRKGLVDEGLGELDLLLAQAPEYAPGHLEAGKVRLGLGDPAGARPHLEAARRLAPRDVAVLVALARLHVAEGDVESAETILGAASEIDPDSRAVRSERARLQRAAEGT